MAEAHQHGRAGRRRLVVARQRLAGLDQAEGLGGVDALSFQQLAGQELADAALQRQPSVAGTRPGRAAAALGGEVEQAAVAAVVELGEQEAAAVAQIGIVCPELMTVIAQCQRPVETAGQRLEAAEILDPLRIGQRVETDPCGPGLIAMAQDVLGECSGRDRDRRIARRDRHAVSTDGRRVMAACGNQCGRFGGRGIGTASLAGTAAFVGCYHPDGRMTCLFSRGRVRSHSILPTS